MQVQIRQTLVADCILTGVVTCAVCKVMKIDHVEAIENGKRAGKGRNNANGVKGNLTSAKLLICSCMSVILLLRAKE